MTWQWTVFLIVNYVLAAYILRAMVTKKNKPSVARGYSSNKTDYSGLTCAFLVAPLWVWFWVINVGLDKVFRGIGRWISGN